MLHDYQPRAKGLRNYYHESSYFADSTETEEWENSGIKYDMHNVMGRTGCQVGVASLVCMRLLWMTMLIEGACTTAVYQVVNQLVSLDHWWNDLNQLVPLDHWWNDLNQLVSLDHWWNDLNQLVLLDHWWNDLNQLVLLDHWWNDLSQLVSLDHWWNELNQLVSLNLSWWLPCYHRWLIKEQL